VFTRIALLLRGVLRWYTIHMEEVTFFHHAGGCFSTALAQPFLVLSLYHTLACKASLDSENRRRNIYAS
jgi:hypothetical protein